MMELRLCNWPCMDRMRGTMLLVVDIWKFFELSCGKLTLLCERNPFSIARLEVYEVVEPFYIGQLGTGDLM